MKLTLYPMSTDLTDYLVYAFEIYRDGSYVGGYVGKSDDISRPISDYKLNIRNMINGGGSKNKKYRDVHHALRDAVVNNDEIRLLALENGDKDSIGILERSWIERYRQKGHCYNK